MSATPTRRFYRVVATDPPTLRDFFSFKELGRKLRSDAPDYLRDIFDGLSVSSTIASATYTATEWPRIGTFIAVMEVPDDGRFRIEQTTGKPDHYTIWGDPGELMRCVVSIFPARRQRGR